MSRMRVLLAAALVAGLPGTSLQGFGLQGFGLQGIGLQGIGLQGIGLQGIGLPGVATGWAQQGQIGIFPMPPPLPGHTPPPRQSAPQPTPQPPGVRPPASPPPQAARPEPLPPPQPPPPQPPQRQATLQGFPVDVHNQRMQLPVAAGHCGLDETQEADKGIADAVRGNVGNDNLLLAITMDCDGIVAARAGQSAGAYVYTFQTPTQAPDANLARIDQGVAAQRACQNVMQRATETPTRGRTGPEKAAELDTIGRGGQEATAVLQTRGPACYVGHVRSSARDDGGTTVVSEVAVIMVARGRVLIISLNSVNADLLPLMLPRAEALVAQLLALNSGR